jgi:transposase
MSPPSKNAGFVVPEQTAQVARAAFPGGTPYIVLRDQIGVVFTDGDFVDLYPGRGQPGYPAWRLALVTLMQFREGLSDRQAAEAVRARIDWKYLLALDLTDPGFDFSVLCEFRSRLLEHDAEGRLLGRVLDAARSAGLLKERGRQRTDSTHVLGALRVLNRLELVGETMRAALNVIAAAEPDWLRVVAPADWYKRYGRRIEDMRLPDTEPKRDAYARQIGADGFLLLDAMEASDAPAGLSALPALSILRRVWARHFARQPPSSSGPDGSGIEVRLRELCGRGAGDDRVESPYEAEVRFRAKSGMHWTGYMVHLTETCDAGAPHLILHTDTTPADVHEARRTSPIHAGLAAKGLLPSEHLVDSAYVSAELLVEARQRHGIDLVGPARRSMAWQRRVDGGFDQADFVVDWSTRQVRCPERKMSRHWHDYNDKRLGRFVKVRFDPADCTPCPSRARCTRTKAGGRQLSLHGREEHDALVAARARENTDAGRNLYAQRQGVEGTLAQGVHSFGLRRSRYRGLAKTRLQHIASAAALNLDRLGAWLVGRTLAQTHTSRFARLVA